MKAYLLGILFFVINVNSSHMFYQVNSYKIVLILLSVTTLFVVHTCGNRRGLAWSQISILFYPLLITLPGLLKYGGVFNYNMDYELTTNLVLILWAVYVAGSIKSEKDLKVLLLFIGLTGVYVSFYALKELYTMHIPFREKGLRVKSTFGNASYFSAFLMLLTPLFFWLSIHKKRYLLVFFVCIFTLVIARGRAAIVLSILIILGTYTILSRNRLRNALFGGIVTSISVFTTGMLFPKVLSYLRLESLLTYQNWCGRFTAWEAAWDSILGSPLIGYGLGSSYNLYFKFRALTQCEETSFNHAHSELLEFTQEAGILGILILSLFWFYMGKSLLEYYKFSTSPFIKRLLLGIGASTLAYFAHSFVSVAPRMITVRIVIFTFLGVIIALNTQKEKTGTSGSKKVTFLLLCLLIYSYYLFIPWALRQNEVSAFMRKNQQTRSKVVEYDKKFKSWNNPDIYGLYYLALTQHRYQMYDSRNETLRLINGIIPGYRGISISYDKK